MYKTIHDHTHIIIIQTQVQIYTHALGRVGWEVGPAVVVGAVLEVVGMTG